MRGSVVMVWLGVLAVGSSLLAAPRSRSASTMLRATTNPMEQMAAAAQKEAYKASGAVIAAKISMKIAEKEESLPKGTVPIVQEFMRTYLQVVAEQGRDPMSKVPVLKEYLGLVEDQLADPFVFAPYHEAWTEANGAP